MLPNYRLQPDGRSLTRWMITSCGINSSITCSFHIFSSMVQTPADGQCKNKQDTPLPNTNLISCCIHSPTYTERNRVDCRKVQEKKSWIGWLVGWPFFFFFGGGGFFCTKSHHIKMCTPIFQAKIKVGLTEWWVVLLMPRTKRHG